jgi:hypothetical protein
LWQFFNHFPTLEFIRHATTEKYVAIAPLQFFLQLVNSMHPFTFTFWFAGLGYVLFSKRLGQFRILAIIFITVFLILVLNKGTKVEYLSPAFPMLFACGGVAIAKLIDAIRWHWLKPVVITILLFGGAVGAPFAIAVFPVNTYIAYARHSGNAPSTPEKKEIGLLPQFFADMFGWEEMVAAIAKAYDTLTPEEKARCAILMNNYGEAGAVDYWGVKYRLPQAISGHNNYWIWGPRHATGAVVIRIGGSLEAMLQSYRDVTPCGVFKNDYCMPFENNLQVFICKNRTRSLTGDWAEFKHYE